MGGAHANTETSQTLEGLCIGFAVLADMSITGALLGVLYKGRAKQRRCVFTGCPVSDHRVSDEIVQGPTALGHHHDLLHQHR